MVLLSKRHLIRSQRKVTNEQLDMMNNLRSCSVEVADDVHVLRKEAGGSATLGFTQRDAYDAIAGQKKKALDVCHANQLIKEFSKRQANESDFYYDVQLNESMHLLNLFLARWTYA